MQHALKSMDEHWWGALMHSTNQFSAAFRFLTLCSVDMQGQPQARTVVLRAVDRSKRQLRFYTDIRSAKWMEFKHNPAAMVMAYDTQDRVQLRFGGMVQLIESGSDYHAECWSELPLQSRIHYRGGPPGIELADTVEREIEEATSDSSQGREFFGVIVFTSTTLDFVRLDRANNQRARFTYREDGKLEQANWVSP